jgi:hypothetical protein
MNIIDSNRRPRGGDSSAEIRISTSRDGTSTSRSRAHVARTRLSHDSFASFSRSSARAIAGVACAATLLGTGARAQVTFSIDWKGPTISMSPTGGGPPITEGDILMPPPGGPAFGPLPKPQTFLNGGQLGLQFYSSCVGHTAGHPCKVEVDALSFGRDKSYTNTLVAEPASSLTRLWFVVDAFAVGETGSIATPNVLSEAPSGDSAADVFTTFGLPNPPLPPGAVTPGRNVGVFDGNGLPSGSGYFYPGVGLKEPTLPIVPPNRGDHIDALNIGALPTPGMPVFFSLDAAFLDRAIGLPNSGSAAAQGVPAAAVLKKILGSVGPPTVYATPLDLGLDLGGAGTDDLDGLILTENGDGVFQRSLAPYDWVSGATDMLLYSVRRCSAVIGQPDSLFGLPIEPGDILTTPPVLGMRPGIFIAAENLGLRTTRTDGVMFGDDLGDMTTTALPCYDCNHNGVEDAVDISSGTSADANMNGIPDECESLYVPFCMCPSPLAPCGNDDASAGCKNSTGVGGLLGASGTTSYATDDLVLDVSQLPHNKTGLWLSSPAMIRVTLGDGLRCVGSPFYRFGAFNSGPTGVGVKGPGIVASSCSSLPPGGCIQPGSTWNFQVWYRDGLGPCGTGTNLSSAETVTFTP